MLEVDTAEGEPAEATVLSALVAKQRDSDTIQVEASDREQINVRVNGERVGLSVGSEIPAWNAVISRTGEQSYGVRFSSGVNIETKGGLSYLQAVVVSLPKSFMNRSRGLLGYFNGNQADDLLLTDGTVLDLSRLSSIVDVHEGFGLTCELVVKIMIGKNSFTAYDFI